MTNDGVVLTLTPGLKALIDELEKVENEQLQVAASMQALVTKQIQLGAQSRALYNAIRMLK